MGRKRKSNTTRELFMNLRVSPEERELFHTAAELKGLGTSNWVRMVLREQAKAVIAANEKGKPVYGVTKP